MPNVIAVRPVRPGERAAAAALVRRAYAEYGARMAPDAWAGLDAAVRAALADPGAAEWLVAEAPGRGGTLFGSVFLYPPAADAYGGLTGQAPWPELRLLAVAPEARGAGVGRALMNACVARARDTGAAALGLHTSASMTAARALYAAMGFVREPAYDFRPGGAELVEAYRLDLDGPASRTRPARPIDLHHSDAGRGSPALVFLHYYAGSSRAWTSVIAALASGHRCVAVDLRGFGDSPAPNAGYTVDDSADDVAALVAALGLGGPSGPYVLVGHSMGGKIAMALAARRPPGLAGLVLVAPSPPVPEPMTEASRAHTLTSYGDHAAVVETARRITVRPLAPATFGLVVADNLRSSRPAWDAWMLEGSLEDISARMPRVDVPALVVAGGADPVMAHAMLEREVRDRIADARMVDVAGVGHLVPLEAPAELATAVGDFVTALPARA